jgi:quercetin dioxygenase-like cupin family protein
MAASTSSDGYSEPVVDGDASEWRTIGQGIDRQILSYGPDLMLVRVRFEKGAVGAIHHHAHRQATYVVAGSFEATVGDSRQTLRAGDSFFAAADVPHGVRALEDGMLVDCFTPARTDFLETSER